MTEEQLAAKYTSVLMYSIQIHILLYNVFSLDETYSFTLEAEEMVIRPSPFRKSYRSNVTAEQHQQPTIEE